MTEILEENFLNPFGVELDKKSFQLALDWDIKAILKSLYAFISAEESYIKFSKQNYSFQQQLRFMTKYLIESQLCLRI